MKKFILLFLIIVFVLQDSCKKEPVSSCGVEHPEENLPWLKNKLDWRFCTEVYSLIYERIEYIAVSDCAGPDDMIEIFDCHGNKTCEFGGANPGGGTCIMPVGFTWEFYDQNKKLIYNQP